MDKIKANKLMLNSIYGVQCIKKKRKNVFERLMFYIRTRLRKRDWHCSKNCLRCEHYNICKIEFEYNYGKRRK